MSFYELIIKVYLFGIPSGNRRNTQIKIIPGVLIYQGTNYKGVGESRGTTRDSAGT